MSLYHIEPIDRRYNNEILEILRSAPITTENLTVYFDRQPDYFKLAEIKYHPHFYYGLFHTDTLKGFGMIGYHNAMINGSVQTVFHLKDFYVTIDARGKGFGFKTTERFFKETYNHSTIGYGILMVGNRASHRYVGQRNSAFPYIPYSRIINQLDVRNILLTWPAGKVRNYTIRPATIQDIPDIVTLLNNEHKERLFGNQYREETFLNYLDNCPGLTISDYYMALDKKGKPSGVCAAWDCSSFKQTRVLRYGRRFLPARVAYKTLALLFHLPPLPLPGGCFKEFMITDYAVRERDPGIMNALLRVVYNDYMKRGYQNMIWGSSADDPLLRASKGFFYQRVVSDIVLITTNPGMLESGAVRNQLPYIDLPCL
jgi:hypothetical protein